MNNTSVYKISVFLTPFTLRVAGRLMGMINLFVTYLQYLLLRLELFNESSTIDAYMTPQVCYIEKMLQLYISPQAVINPQAFDVTLWRQDEAGGTDLFIDDSDGQIFYTDPEFGMNEFTVLLPASVAGLVNYAKEIIDRYRLPGKLYTIILR